MKLHITLEINNYLLSYLEEILGSKAYTVSNGSYFPISQTGACAWIIATRDGAEWIKGVESSLDAKKTKTHTVVSLVDRLS